MDRYEIMVTRKSYKDCVFYVDSESADSACDVVRDRACDHDWSEDYEQEADYEVVECRKMTPDDDE